MQSGMRGLKLIKVKLGTHFEISTLNLFKTYKNTKYFLDISSSER